MNRIPRLARIAFALGIMGLGVLGLIHGAFPSGWPAWVPWRRGLLDAGAAVMLLGGAGLLFERTLSIAVRVLLPFLLLWTLLRSPTLGAAPQIEVNWLSVGETAVLVAGAWLIFSDLGRAAGGSIVRGIGARRVARSLFACALLAFGLSHFFYNRETAGLVPAWLPFHTGWAYFTGAGHLAEGLGVLFSIRPRLAATLEAVMLGTFTALVWIPAIATAPKTQSNWGEFVLSWAIAAGAWVVAGSLLEATSPQAIPAAAPSLLP